MYFPDFRIHGKTLVEIKGDDQFDGDGRMVDKLNPSKNHVAEAKHRLMERLGAVVLKYNDVKPYLEYVYGKYGRNYLRQFKKRKTV